MSRGATPLPPGYEQELICSNNGILTHRIHLYGFVVAHSMTRDEESDVFDAMLADAMLDAEKRAYERLWSFDWPPGSPLPYPGKAGPEFNSCPAELVVPAVAGSDMGEYLVKNIRSGRPEDCVAAVESARKSLLSLHSSGVVHGDPSPANIIIKPSGAAVIINYGYSTLEDDGVPKGAAELDEAMMVYGVSVSIAKAGCGESAPVERLASSALDVYRLFSSYLGLGTKIIDGQLEEIMAGGWDSVHHGGMVMTGADRNMCAYM